MPSHYLNQCLNIVNWTLGNKLQWHFNQSSHIFFQENALENVVWKMSAILSQPQCVKLGHALPETGECAVPGLNATFCFLWFTSCVLLFDKSIILGCSWPLVFVLNNILILGIWCSTIPHLPGCFCPWTFFENIGFNTVLTDPFMSHLATQLGYSAGEFQALQLIVLAAFGIVD